MAKRLHFANNHFDPKIINNETQPMNNYSETLYFEIKLMPRWLRDISYLVTSHFLEFHEK